MSGVSFEKRGYPDGPAEGGVLGRARASDIAGTGSQYRRTAGARRYRGLLGAVNLPDSRTGGLRETNLAARTAVCSAIHWAAGMPLRRDPRTDSAEGG